MKLYNNNIISFPKTGTKFLSKKLTSTDDLTYEDLFTNEKYKDKSFYIIIRNPKDNLISAINVSLGYEYNPTLKQTMEDILLNKDVHFNTNRFQMLSLYNKFNKNITFVELNNLSNFLENIVGLPSSDLTIDQSYHRTHIVMNENDIINGEPYLWKLFTTILEQETHLYNELINGKNVYQPKGNLI